MNKLLCKHCKEGTVKKVLYLTTTGFYWACPKCDSSYPETDYPIKEKEDGKVQRKD